MLVNQAYARLTMCTLLKCKCYRYDVQHVSDADTSNYFVIINFTVIGEQPQTITKYNGCTTRTTFGAEI